MSLLMQKASILLLRIVLNGFLLSSAKGIAKNLSSADSILIPKRDSLNQLKITQHRSGRRIEKNSKLPYYFDSLHRDMGDRRNGVKWENFKGWMSLTPKTKSKKKHSKKGKKGKGKASKGKSKQTSVNKSTRGKAKENKTKADHSPEKKTDRHHFFFDTKSSMMYGRGGNPPNKKKKPEHKHPVEGFTDMPCPLSDSSVKRLTASRIPKFVEDLPIPFVLYDVKEGNKVEVSLRQISQQVLPEGYPSTKLWAYGNPEHPSTFFHPSGTIENTEYNTLTVTWTNELVVDPVKCRRNPDSDACNFLMHVIQDSNGVPIVDQTLHWAAPNQDCASGEIRSDCRGTSTSAYQGPIPLVTHVHGAHVEYHSDGYPESWYLPNANNIPDGYAKRGRFYTTKGSKQDGSAVYRYDNSETSTTLFYHDHTLGLTRLNVYAAGGGFWLIRKKNERDDFLRRKQQLPGPPPIYGEDPNSDPDVRKKIREIPIMIQQMSFYEDGRLFYPANRVYQQNDTCSDGGVFADTSGMPNIPFLPSKKSDISPIWNPEAFFDTWVVNGKTWPKLEVAPERYRFRLLNVADSAALNIYLKTSDGKKELTFYVIGSEQGLLPDVVGIRTGKYTVYHGKQGTANYLSDTFVYDSPQQAFLIDPGERYDVIVDFSGCTHGTEIIMYNSAPDGPFKGFDSPEYAPADIHTTGQVMKFIINDELKNPDGDQSTRPRKLRLKSPEPKSDVYHRTRDLVILEQDSKVCVDGTGCDSSTAKCDSKNAQPFGPTMAMLGYGQKNTTAPSMWDDPICMNPQNGTTEIVNLWNWTPDAHPIHFHLVNFQILGRYDIFDFEDAYDGNNAFPHGVKPVMGHLPYEYMKDTAIAYPNTVTQLWISFDRPGLYVWHCHILSHEDNEMMLPYCVGEPGVDCPAELFVGSESFCSSR